MKVYADNAATTAMSPVALRETVNCLENVYGNASSVHSLGQLADEKLEQARNILAEKLGALPKEIYFTSGGTEADNWALNSAYRWGVAKGKKHIISTTFEHHAVLHTLQKLEKQGAEVTYLPVHKDGIVRLDELAQAIRPDTALVTIMYANNEIGTIQPIAEIGALCREKGVFFHTDAVQAVGHIPVNVQKENIDMLSFSGHKFHGPKGVGALYCRTGVPLASFMEGGAQERNRRGGTENVPAIVGMAAALAEACDTMDEVYKKVAGMRDYLIEELSKIPHSCLNGNRENRLPGIVNFCFEGIEGEAMLLLLDLAGVCGSSGSACTSGSLDPSHVLLALGLPHEIAHGSLRLSLSEYNTQQEMEYIIEKLPPIIRRLRDMSPMWEKLERENSHGI